ncbi:MAG: DUF881 domain-containing protein [Actinomycetaceae bacterium]|nr:DUF881 domain-containing protein [Actinomycetaceae bacterium]
MRVRNLSKRRLRDLLTVRFRPIHILIGLLTLLVGFAFVAQVKQQRSDPLDGVHEDELVLLLDQLTEAEDRLREERGELSDQLSKLQSAHSQDEAARQSAERERALAQILGGTMPVEGPGLTLKIIEGDTPISAQKFITILGELRNAGAEAVDLNGIRIVASSYITSDEAGNLSVSGIPIRSPYVWTIIGDADTIQPALEIARGATSQLRAVDATIELTREENLKIDSVETPKPYRYAKPVE